MNVAFRLPALGYAALLCVSVVSGCVFDAALKHDTGTKPEQLHDGWLLDTPKGVGLSSAKLQQIHSELLREDRYRGVLALLVVKDGKLVFETYLRQRSDQGHYRHVQSVTKSITSLLVGMLFDQGTFESLDATVADLLPKDVKGLASKKKAITLRNLLTMTSGLNFDNEVFSTEMWVTQPDHPVRYILDKPLYADPGTKFYYRDADPQLVGYAMTQALAESEQQLADRSLFTPLGIRDYYWDSGPDDISMAAHGLHLLPRDLAKLGQLVLQRGVWKDERLVSEQWLNESTRAQIESDVRYADEPIAYGYYWWVVPGIGYAMWGHGGQFVLIVPEQEMVVVQTAFPDSDLPDSELPDFLRLLEPILNVE